MGCEIWPWQVAFMCDSRKPQINDCFPMAYSTVSQGTALMNFQGRPRVLRHLTRQEEGKSCVPVTRKTLTDIRELAAAQHETANGQACFPFKKKKETPKQTAIFRMEMYPYPILPFPTLLVKVETEKNLPGRSLATQSTVFAVTWLPTQRACSNTYSDG